MRSYWIVATWMATTLFTWPPTRTAEAALTDGLVGYWSFDACDATDDSGNGHGGVLYGAPTCVAGIQGKALEYDGLNAYVNITDTTFGNLGSDATLSVWVKTNPVAGSETRIFEKDSYSYWIFGEREGSVYFAVNQYPPFADSKYYIAKSTDIANQWTFLAAVKQGGNYDIYLNGSHATTLNTRQVNITNPIALTFGRSQFFGTGYFRGDIDEARVYARALAPSEILELSQIGGTPAPRGCFGDFNGDNRVTIDELITGVNNALNGCDRPLQIGGSYAGEAQEILSGECSGPVDLPQTLQGITVEVSSQNGSAFTGSYSGQISGGGAFTIDVRGTVDSTGNMTNGTLSAATTAARPFSGTFGGRVVENKLVLSYAGQSGTCNVVGSAVGIRPIP